MIQVMIGLHESALLGLSKLFGSVCLALLQVNIQLSAPEAATQQLCSEPSKLSAPLVKQSLSLKAL